MRKSLLVMSMLIACASPAPASECAPLVDGSAGGGFLEEVTKVLRGGFLEEVLTGQNLCASVDNAPALDVMSESTRMMRGTIHE